MSDSTPRSRRSPAPGADELPPGAEGLWELDLWNGSACFSEWFYQRLQWPTQVEHKKLADLRPNLTPEAWEMLLRAIRKHLELGAPLYVEIPVELTDGRSEHWRFEGSSERNSGGQPVHIAGSVREVGPERRRGQGGKP